MKYKYWNIKIVLIYFVLLALPHSLFAMDYNDFKTNADTVYIKKGILNKKENSFDYILLYQAKNKCYEVYRKKVVDFSEEVKYNFSYSDNTKKYVCYTEYDFTAGIKISIFYDKKNNSFFITEVYDPKAIGDKIIKKSVDFDKHTARVKSIDNGKVTYYVVKFKEIKLKISSECDSIRY